jgi:DNA-binding transcriptional MerR regulator
MSEAGEKPYRSISEVSEFLGIKAHVLRYWETQFSMLRPRKNRAGARMYRPKDVELLREIQELLHGRGFTIAGARRKLLDERKRGDEGPAPEARLVKSAEPVLRKIRKELAEISELLKAPPARGAGGGR